jgi:hypothetical protein
MLAAAARELRAHGHQAESDAMFERALAWFRGAGCDAMLEGGEEGTPHSRYRIGRTLYESGHLEEASELFQTIKSDERHALAVAGTLGGIAARQCKRREASEAITALKASVGRFRFGRPLVWTARIAAASGDSGAAVNALRAAFARGYRHGIPLHADVDLALLRDHSGFNELMRPRG